LDKKVRGSHGFLFCALVLVVGCNELREKRYKPPELSYSKNKTES